jgi:hypothetical protein
LPVSRVPEHGEPLGLVLCHAQLCWLTVTGAQRISTSEHGDESVTEPGKNACNLQYVYCELAAQKLGGARNVPDLLRHPERATERSITSLDDLSSDSACFATALDGPMFDELPGLSRRFCADRPDVLLLRADERVVKAMLSGWRHRCVLAG